MLVRELVEGNVLGGTMAIVLSREVPAIATSSAPEILYVGSRVRQIGEIWASKGRAVATVAALAEGLR